MHKVNILIVASLLLPLALLTGTQKSASAQDNNAAPAQPTPPSTPAGVDLEARAGLFEHREKAIALILEASRSTDPFLRANAIEAIQPAKQRALPLAQIGLRDRHPAVRFASLVTLGQIGRPELAEAIDPLLGDENPSVRAAAMVAARRCGAKINLSSLATMMRSPNPGLRSNIALLMGMLDEPSAANMLEATVKTPMHRASEVQQSIVRVQVAEAVVKLGKEKAIDAIRAAAYSPHGEVRVLAVMILGRLNDRRMIPAFEAMLDQPPQELQLAAATSLAQLGNGKGVAKALELSASQAAPMRVQSAFALGVMARDKRATRRLVELLGDPHLAVRVAAAAAILKITDAPHPGDHLPQPKVAVPQQGPAAKHPGTEQPNRVTVVNITEQGEVFYGTTPVDLATLKEKLAAQAENEQDVKVVIRSDKNAAMTHVTRVMDAVRKAGISDVALQATAQ